MSRHKIIHHVAFPFFCILLFNAHVSSYKGAFSTIKTETPTPVNLEYLSHFLQNLPFSHQRPQSPRTFQQQYEFHQYSPVSTPFQYQYQSPRSMSHNDILWKMWLRNSHRNSHNQYVFRYPLKLSQKDDHPSPSPSEKEQTVQFPIRFRIPKIPADAKQNYNDLVQAESQTTTTTSDKKQQNDNNQNEITKSKSQETETSPYSKSYLKQLKKSSEKKQSILEKLALKKRLFKKKWASKQKYRKTEAQEESRTRRRRAAPKKEVKKETKEKEVKKEKEKEKEVKKEKDAKKKGGRGDMAAVGTTANANYDSAVANADAAEGTRNDAKFAETNALVWRGGQENMQTGFAGIREWHPHGGICLHPPCKKVANSLVIVEDNNIVKGANEEPDIDYYKIAVMPPSKDDEGKLALKETVPDIDYYKIAVLPPSRDDEGKPGLTQHKPDIDYYKIAVLPPSRDDEGKPGLLQTVPDIDYYKIAVLPPSKDDEGKVALREIVPDIDYYKIAVLPPSKDDEGKIALREIEPDIDYYKIAVLPPSKDDEGKVALRETEPDIDYYKIAVLPPSKDDEGKIAIWEAEPDQDYYKISIMAPDVDDPLPGAVPPPLIQKMGPFPPNPNPYSPIPFETLISYKIIVGGLAIDDAAAEHGSRWDQQWGWWTEGSKPSFAGPTTAHTRASAPDFDPSKYEITKEESEAFSNRDHGAAGQKSRDDRFELFDKFSRYDPFTALVAPVEPFRPVYLCPFAPPAPLTIHRGPGFADNKFDTDQIVKSGHNRINLNPSAPVGDREPDIGHEKGPKKKQKGNGHLATSGTTSIAGKNTALSTADAQDATNNVVATAGSNAMVYRGGVESISGGSSDRGYFHKGKRICVGSKCKTTKKNRGDEDEQDHDEAAAKGDGFKKKFKKPGKGMAVRKYGFKIHTGPLGNIPSKSDASKAKAKQAEKESEEEVDEGGLVGEGDAESVAEAADDRNLPEGEDER